MAKTSQPAPLWRCFATTAPGLERVLAAELRALGYARVEIGPSGAGFMTDRAGFERAGLTLRTAHRLLWVLAEIGAADADDLYTNLRRSVHWEGLIPPDRTLAVDASARDNAALRDGRFVALKAKDAIVDTVRDARGTRPSVELEAPDVLVRVTVRGPRAIVALDGAGKAALHARGYRLVAGRAPLRETLAAGVLMLAGWTGAEPLVDPLCGSGTLPIEGALLARGIAPGTLGRRFGFERWPGHRADRFAAAISELRRAARPRATVSITGSDRVSDATRDAQSNAMRAGVAGDVRFDVADARSWTPPAGPPGLIVANAPYGERLEDRAGAHELMEALGRRWREVARGWRAAVLVGHPDDARALALGRTEMFALKNGELDVTLVTGRID